jgi:hypothetical protein
MNHVFKIFMLYLTTLNCRKIKELEKTGKEVVVVQFKIQYRHFPGRTEETRKKKKESIKVISVQAGIRTDYLPNTCIQRCR